MTETLPYGQGQTIPRTLNLDATQTYDTEGIGGHLKTGHPWTLHNRATERNQNKS